MHLGEHKWFNVARKIALSNQQLHKQYNLGAVLVKGGSIISTGRNKSKTDPLIDFMADRYNGKPQQVHAEIDALSGVQRHCIRGCDIFVVRVRATDNSFAPAKPCAMCEAFLRKHRIRKVFYSINGAPNSNTLEYGVIKL